MTGVALKRAGLIDDPIPGDAPILAQVGECVVQVLVRPTRPFPLLAQLSTLHQLVEQKSRVGRDGTVAFVLL